jgi:DNA helicase-2/ATP-dependent DNA helicase PcrA
MPDHTPHTREQYNESFLLALEQLNPRQRAAVDHIEGPVLVIAGPGTGKTHILTARIGRILMETDTQPHNILCLAFTDAAVRAMRERLLDFIGPEAHRVHIYTFHSFCNGIIQDNLELFGRHDLEPLSDLERVEIFRRLLDELDPDHPLRRGRTDIYFYEEHLYDLFKRMKREDWTVDLVLDRIDAYLADLPNRPEFVYQRKAGRFRKGDLKEARMAEEERQMERLRAAVKLYPRFMKAMRRARRYDYDDMILWVLRAFEEHEALLRTYQEQYLYFLVDEYQDTNGAQNEILHKLIDFWENPNVFIVGDDDQSIFEFQGARLKNLTEFYESYQDDLELIVLKNNYRSSQLILDTSRALIRHNENRIVNNLRSLGIDKVLEAAHEEFSKSRIAPQVLAFPNRMQEEAFIIERLARLQEEGFPLEEVALLYARHRQANNLIKLLEKRGIPYNVKRRVNILRLPLIENLRDILAYLQLESERSHSGEHLLFRILHFQFTGVAPSDIARLSAHLGQYDWRERLPWRTALRDRSLLQSLSLENPEAILAWSEVMDGLLRELHQLPLPALVERVINRCGLLRYVLDHEERNWYIQVVKTFFDFVQQECERNPRLQLPELMEHFRRMDANRLPIELNKEVRSEKGVNLVTAHSAKGLEFRYVFIIDCVKDYWEPRGRRGNYRFSLPDTLTYSGEEDALEARRRLFYVAMTRAKEHLWLTYSRQDPAGKELQRAIFIDEITQAMNLEAEPREVAEDVLLEAQILYLQESARPRLPLPPAVELEALLEGFTLSISTLNSYLYCPLGFFYEHLLRVPVQESEAASYGTAAHQALQRLFERMLRTEDKVFPGRETLVSLFEYEMENRRGNFSPKEYLRRLEMGRRYLSAYYDLYHHRWPKKVQVEHTIRNVEVDGVPLTGTIDRLDLQGESKVHIVDYKTGVPRDRRMRSPTSADPHGGSYWRQLIFYKLLFDNSGVSDRRAASATISYLEPDRDGEFVEKHLRYKPKEVAAVRELIREVYAKIRRHEFTEGCGDPRCQWCHFARHNVAVNSFADPELEALDD